MRRVINRNTRKHREDLRECLYGLVAGIMLVALFFLLIFIQPAVNNFLINLFSW